MSNKQCHRHSVIIRQIDLSKGEAVIDHVICKHGVQGYLIFDEDATFSSRIMQYVYKKLGLRIMTVSLYNHRNIRSATFNKPIIIMLAKWLVVEGKQWAYYLQMTMFTYSVFSSSDVDGLNPYKLNFSRDLRSL